MKKLNVGVVVRNSNGKQLSEIFVRMGSDVVGKLTSVGRWTEFHAMREFKLFSQRFTPCNGSTKELLKEYSKLVA